MKMTLIEAITICEAGTLDAQPPGRRKLLLGVLSRVASGKTLAAEDSVALARKALDSVGVVRKPERHGTPLERSRAALIDRQKGLLREEMHERAKIVGGEKPNTMGMVSLLNPGPYRLAAAFDLVEAGEAVLIRDEIMAIKRGRVPAEGKRRDRRVVVIGLPGAEAFAKGSQEEAI